MLSKKNDKKNVKNSLPPQKLSNESSTCIIRRDLK